MLKLPAIVKQINSPFHILHKPLHCTTLEKREREREGGMEWFYAKRRGPEWKYGWKGQTLASISTPPFPLLAIFAIVIFLLSLSQYSNYKTRMQSTMISFQLFLLLSPILLIFVVLSGLTSGRFSLRTLRPRDQRDPSGGGGGGGGSPWAVAILVLVLLVLVSYQSSFHLKWFGSV